MRGWLQSWVDGTKRHVWARSPAGQRSVRTSATAGARGTAESLGSYAGSVSNRVLIVEDDAVIADEVRRALDAHGYATELATTGRAGLAAAETFQPDLVVLDLGLPDLDGV